MIGTILFGAFFMVKTWKSRRDSSRKEARREEVPPPRNQADDGSPPTIPAEQDLPLSPATTPPTIPSPDSLGLPSSSSSTLYDPCRVFVRMDRKSGKIDLREFFKDAGTIVKIDIPKRKGCTRTRIAFVTFAEEESVAHALGLDKVMKVRVQRARRKGTSSVEVD